MTGSTSRMMVLAFPKDDAEAVFEAGYSTAKGGTGFWLNIVKEVADDHGWGVRVTDGSEGGARFEITGIENGDSNQES